MKKKTYGQKWPAYNAAQVNEKAKFLRLVHELCAGVAEPVQPCGRARLPVADMLFSMALKVYTTFSCRRFMADLQQAYEDGLTSRLPRYNSIFNYFQMKVLTSYLSQLVVESSVPLRTIEKDFAVDSSGFSTSNFARWIDIRFGNAKIIDKRKWVKVHLMCGVSTNIVTAVEVSKANAGDSPYLKPLFETTDRNFGIREQSGDKAYSSLANLKLVVDKGAMPYIPFRANAKAVHGTKDPLWTRLFHFYAYNEEWFKEHYHKRSNVESTFSMIKAKFGGRLRSKKEIAQINKVLCKVVCHNICVLIQSIYELGIEVAFWNDRESKAS
ncbi:MAG: transposase [Pyrinomonadaceae bacterium]